ncbi:uncharacterized protein PAC_12467 [Phialocephala subalpina]|uniref:Uncharacterized protein n=1 Tax=Phialocephala subalpina TaxID=576137 RepID=A0A1L7XBZ0_9HELO|nr:uncharacterized protein PAC_12467 [Phialocephala subalpina]
MSPPIGTSVRSLNSEPECWMLGSSKVCERVTVSYPPNVPIPSGTIISWKDGEHTFYLREREDADDLLEDGSQEGLIHAAGTSAAIWSLGADTICKVKAWSDGLESESDTIEFIDHDWSRSFLMMKRVPGQTLRDAWPYLSLPQKSQIASQVARYCFKLAVITSTKFESATHRGVLEPFFMTTDPSHPSWKPKPLGPLSLTDLNLHLSKSFIGFEVGSTLHFYHADFGPGSIMVSKEGNVEVILDWESAGFYPKSWIASKHILNAGFYLAPTQGTNRMEWRDFFVSMLKERGFEPTTFTKPEPKEQV